TPLHIEIAAWVCGASETLLALLLLPSFLLYLKSQDANPAGADGRSSRIKFRVASLGFLAAALFAKETAIFLLDNIFSYEMISGGVSSACQRAEYVETASRFRTLFGRTIRAMKRILPYVALSAVYLAIRALVIGILIYQPARQALFVRVLTV